MHPPFLHCSSNASNLINRHVRRRHCFLQDRRHPAELVSRVVHRPRLELRRRPHHHRLDRRHVLPHVLRAQEARHAEGRGRARV
jgi:hypothetical protein